MNPRIVLMGVPIDQLTADQVVGKVFDALRSGRGGWLFTPNLDILRSLVIDPEYAALTSRATIRIADGMPLIWASRLQGTPLPERIAGSEIIWEVCDRAAAEGKTIFMLGGNPGSAESALSVLQRRFPNLRSVGSECPPLGFERDPAYLENLERIVREADPDLCFVGLPAYKQDRLIRRLMEQLPNTWFLGIGVTFSFVAGEFRKAPRWMRRCGLEWLHRLMQEPRRLAKRYLLHGLPFAMWLLMHSAFSRFRGSALPARVYRESAPR
jgi:N-acetylglucosaminyldiphosphoundecaprenol N-acetyl-beta-D-mannosaminyltransferase